MPKRITIEPHLSVVDLEQRYRQTNDAVERSHYQIIWSSVLRRLTAEPATAAEQLLAQGRRTEIVLFGFLKANSQLRLLIGNMNGCGW